MRLLIAAAVLACAGAAQAASCRLTGADYASLAESKSKLTQEGVEGLSPAKQALLCKTRAFLKRVDGNGGRLDKLDTYSPFYLTGEERDRVNRAVDAILQSYLADKGIKIGVGR